MALEVVGGIRTTYGLQYLGAGGRGLGDDIELGAGPVRRHLAASGTGISGSTYCLQEVVERRHPQRQGESTITIVRIKPVITAFEHQSGGDTHSLMPCSGDLEKYLLLAFEKNFPVVQPAGKKHHPVDVYKLLRGKAAVGFCRFADRLS